MVKRIVYVCIVYTIFMFEFVISPLFIVQQILKIHCKASIGTIYYKQGFQLRNVGGLFLLNKRNMI